MREILRELVIALEAGREVVTCQVLSTRGSTPQKAGAMMLLSADGGQLGTLGGGCVEAEVKRKAASLIGRADAAEVFAFVLNHDSAWADGLICGGKMTILAQSSHGPLALAYFRVLAEIDEIGTGFTEAVSLDSSRSGVAPGSRFLFDEQGRLVVSLDGNPPPAEIAARITPMIDRPRPSEESGVSYLPNPPRIRLVIIGAGHVGQMVAELASRADFEVWVVDDRRDYVSRERFPMARRLLVGPIPEIIAGLEINARTYALIVTRGHGHDEEALASLAPTLASYVGMIGSRRKIRMIFDALLDRGILESDLSRVSAPVGLEIGSQSVFEIAVSIVAELIDRRNRGNPAMANPLLTATTNRG